MKIEDSVLNTAGLTVLVVGYTFSLVRERRRRRSKKKKNFEEKKKEDPAETAFVTWAMIILKAWNDRLKQEQTHRFLSK